MTRTLRVTQAALGASSARGAGSPFRNRHLPLHRHRGLDEAAARAGRGEYAEALASIAASCARRSRAHGGVEVDTQGDAFFVAFPTAPGALAAAAEALDGLAAGPIRVRMGIHTGTPHLAEEGYVGVDVHRAARIAACGHGGQVLVSASTAALVGHGRAARPGRAPAEGPVRARAHLPARRRRLPAAQEPAPDEPADPGDALPRPRARARRGARRCSRADVRLLTLTGPGGTGKTRLALQAAAEASERYPDGVFWVPLAPLRDPELVLETAGQALGAKDGLAEHIGDKSLLLLLDNFEHVDRGGRRASPSCSPPARTSQLLVTSRELLRVPGEQAYPVPPLEPEDGVELFLARARAVDAGLRADDAVAEICARLEHLPLALELAAARVAGRSRPSSSSSGSRSGSTCSRPAAASTRASGRCARRSSGATTCSTRTSSGSSPGSPSSAAAARSRRPRRSATQTSTRSSRSSTRASFASARASASGCWRRSASTPPSGSSSQARRDDLRRRHADYFLALAEEAEPHLTGSEPAQWLDRLEARARQPPRRPRLARGVRRDPAHLRLAGALWRFWDRKGHLAEGRRRLESALRDDSVQRRRVPKLSTEQLTWR